MKIDIFLTRTIDDIIMTLAGRMIRNYFPSHLQIFINHDVMYHFDEFKAESRGEQALDVDPEKRCAQIINHELCHATRSAFYLAFSSDLFHKSMIIGTILGAMMTIVLFFIFFTYWTMTFIVGGIFCAYLGYKSVVLWLKDEDEAVEMEMQTDMNNGYNGINKELFDKVIAMK